MNGHTAHKDSIHDTLPSATPPSALVDSREHVREMLKEFSEVMLVSGEGSDWRGRPMHVAHIDDDCTVWFFTSIDSQKVEEAAGGVGMIIAQGKMRFVAMQGSFAIDPDIAHIRALWSKANEVWFPKGPTDPRVCLLGFRPDRAELWDSSGSKGLKYLFDSAKALATGKAPTATKEQHDEVDMRRRS